MHCAVATGIDTTTFTCSSGDPGSAEEALLHVEHHLALDEQIVVEDQAVLREVDRALDRVLDGDEADVDPAGVHGPQDLRHRGQRHELAGREIGLGQERLLGERPQRAEEPDSEGARSDAGSIGHGPAE